MNAHTNPFQYFLDRERAAGHRPRLPQPTGNGAFSRNQSDILKTLADLGPLSVAQIADALRPIEESTVRQALFDLRMKLAVREVRRTGERNRVKIWEITA